MRKILCGRAVKSAHLGGQDVGVDIEVRPDMLDILLIFESFHEAEKLGVPCRLPP